MGGSKSSEEGRCQDYRYVFVRQHDHSFGCPKVLVSDRGSHFVNELIAELTTHFKIDHRFSAPYHPQTNGQTEQTNQTLCRILRKTVDN